jgi:hypothetical protein
MSQEKVAGANGANGSGGAGAPLAVTQFRAAVEPFRDGGAGEDRRGRDAARDGMYESDWAATKRFFASVVLGLDVVVEEVEQVGAAQKVLDELMRRAGGESAAVAELVGGAAGPARRAGRAAEHGDRDVWGRGTR